jgi:hypothetical protein
MQKTKHAAIAQVHHITPYFAEDEDGDLVISLEWLKMGVLVNVTRPNVVKHITTPIDDDVLQHYGDRTIVGMRVVGIDAYWLMGKQLDAVKERLFAGAIAEDSDEVLRLYDLCERFTAMLIRRDNKFIEEERFSKLHLAFLRD